MDTKHMTRLIEEIEGYAVEDMPIEDLVELGATLDALQKQARVATDTIRERLRHEALVRQGGTPGAVCFTGGGGSTATVTIPAHRWVFKREPSFESLGSLEREIGEAALKRLVTMNVEPHPRIDALAEEFDPAVRDRILPLLDQADATPKVRFEQAPE